MKADGNYRKSNFLITLQKTSRHRVQTQQSHTVGHSARKFSWFSYVPVCNVSQHQLAPVDKGQAGKPQTELEITLEQETGKCLSSLLMGSTKGLPSNWAAASPEAVSQSSGTPGHNQGKGYPCAQTPRKSMVNVPCIGG